MGEWKEVILKDVVSILGDGLHGTPNYDDNGDYYFINGNNLSDGKIIIKDGTKRANKDEYEKYKKNLNERTILVSINGTIGNVALYDNEKCILGKSACYFNVIDEIERDFIKYVVTNKNFQEYLHNFANGTTIKNVSLNSMREYPFLLPPLSEQQSIASVLSSIDDKIDLLHRQNKTLEQLTETLFRQWFVVNQNPNAISEKFGNLVQFMKGKKPNDAVENFIEGLVPQILIETFDTGKTFFSDPTEMVIADKKDILMVMDGASSGRVEIGISGIVGSTIGLFRPTKNFDYPLFLFYFLKTNEDFIKDNTTGSAIPHTDRALVLDLDVEYSSIEKVKEFEAITENYFSKRQSNKIQICTLTQLRDTLLPKLMSGEVRVNIKG